MDIQAAVLGEVEDPGWDEETEGDGDDEGDGGGWGPACEGVDGVSS